MGDGNFRPPQNLYPLTDHQKNLVQVITSVAPTAVPHLVQILWWGLLGKWVKYNLIFFINTFLSWAHLQVRPVDGFHAGWLKQRGLAEECAFWRFRWHCSPFWGWNSPKTPIFGDIKKIVNRRFQAKRAKYWKFHVIETIASISTKFCTTLETIKRSSRVVRIGAQQIQDGGRPPFWKKPLNRHIFATVWPILMKFGTMTHIGRLQRKGW